MGEYPDAGFFGGRVLPDWRLGRPTWLIDEDLAHLSSLIVKFDLGERTRPLVAADPLPFGASFGLRRGLIERTGDFRTDLGVVGDAPGRGEEAEYLERARAAGAAGVYIGTAVSFHQVDRRRFRLGYLYRYGVEKGVAASRMQRTSAAGDGSVASALGFLFKGVFQLLRGRGDRFRQCVINSGIEMGLRRERPGGSV